MTGRSSFGADGCLTQARLERAAEEQVQHPDPNDPSAPRLEWTRARLPDLILPRDAATQVEELLDAARQGRTVVEGWGVGRHLSGGRGVVRLLPLHW
jgi:hypothetical protein